MPAEIPPSETRPLERIRAHYQIEKALAARLRSAGKDERRQLYTAVYDELFRAVPDHPQLTHQANAEQRQREVSERRQLLRRYVRADSTYLEIGPGDCALPIEIAKHARKVYAIDVSRELAANVNLPSNMELLLSDGCSIPVPAESVDVAYSDQLMEHLHPDDAAEQLANIYRALKPGGVYICITPNRLSGPHDVSRYFDEVATGFHLREYTITELSEMFTQVGFRKLAVLVGARGVHVSAPAPLIRTAELFLTKLPARMERMGAHASPFRPILGAKIVGTR